MSARRLIVAVALAAAVLACCAAGGDGARLSTQPAKASGAVAPLDRVADRNMLRRDMLKVALGRFYTSLDEPSLQELLEGAPLGEHGVATMRQLALDGYKALQRIDKAKGNTEAMLDEAEHLLHRCLTNLGNLIDTAVKEHDKKVKAIDTAVEVLKGAYAFTKITTTGALEFLEAVPVTKPAAIALSLLYQSITAYTDARVQGKPHEAAVGEAGFSFCSGALSKLLIFKADAVADAIRYSKLPAGTSAKAAEAAVKLMRESAGSQSVKFMFDSTVSVTAGVVAKATTCAYEAAGNAAKVAKCKEDAIKKFKTDAAAAIVKKVAQMKLNLPKDLDSQKAANVLVGLVAKNMALPVITASLDLEKAQPLPDLPPYEGSSLLPTSSLPPALRSRWVY